jgi:hypothetical protein
LLAVAGDLAIANARRGIKTTTTMVWMQMQSPILLFLGMTNYFNVSCKLQSLVETVDDEHVLLAGIQAGAVRK